MLRTKIKVCKFCVNKDEDFNYKHERKWRMFINERGKIIPRRMTGTCAKHQRKLTTSIKRARYLAILPFTSEMIR
ncbi:MAG: 30S ribosomal protein S18 [Candidatus Latescibacteria bacterium]|nr:30S ribosomal protein S18 [Candidatus Latescibacterota bacterium]